MSRRDIVFLASNFPPGGGGAAVVYYQLCKQFGGDACAIVSSSNSDETKRFDSGQTFPVIRLPFLAAKPIQGRWRWLCAFWNILVLRLLSRLPSAIVIGFILRQLQPKVVCIGGLWTLYWLLPFIRWTSKARVVFYIHGEEVSTSESKGLVSQWLGRQSMAALKKADAIVAVSGWTSRQLIARGIAPEKVKVIYNGVDHDQFTPGPPDDAILKRHQLTGKRTILTLARLDPRKGHETVLRAIPAVIEQFPDLAYLIVGDGPERKQLRSLVKSLAIDKHVVFASEVSDREVPAYYRTCELLVQPNHQMPNGDDEGFGLVFLEAGACHRPVIGGRSGGVPEAILDGETGILVNGSSVDETARAIIQLLGNAQLSNRMASNGWSRSHQFDWRQTAAQFRSLCW
jgi:phosphatidyl-myo-inositol dimannoside synthase